MIAALVPRAIDVLAFGRDWAPDAVVALERRPFPGVQTRTLEHAASVRRAWTNDDLTRVVRSIPSGATVLPYATGRALDETARTADLTVAAPPAMLKERLDDKSFARHILARAGVRVPDSVVVRSVDEWPDWMGYPVIVQPRAGSTGKGVLRVDGTSGRPDRYPPEGLLVSRFVQGVVLNTHLLVGAGATLTAPWSVQAAGVPALGGWQFSYGGNDFVAGATVLESFGSQTTDLAVRVGGALRKLGWWGLAGIDAIHDGRDLWLLEINPRLQGSSWLLAECQAAAGAPVLGAAHRQLQLGGLEPTIPANSDAVPLSGAALIVRAGERHAAPERDLDGAWSWDGTRLGVHRAAFGLIELRAGEVLIDGCARHPVERGGVLARIAARDQLLDAGGQLTPDGSALVAAVRSALIGRS